MNTMDNKRGVLLIAGGYEGFGKMAYNLAAQIRNYSPNIPIRLVTWDNALARVYMLQKSDVFNEIIEAPRELLAPNGHRYAGRLKCSMFWLSDFEETIYIDADSLLLRAENINKMFDACKDFALQFNCKGKVKSTDNHSLLGWAENLDTKAAFGYDNDVPLIRSSFVYFKDTPEVEAFFEEALKTFDALIPGVKGVKGAEWQGRFQPADELALMVAAAKTGVTIGDVNYSPLYDFISEGQFNENKKAAIVAKYMGITVAAQNSRVLNGAAAQRYYDELLTYALGRSICTNCSKSKIDLSKSKLQWPNLGFNYVHKENFMKQIPRL
jgi:hypothetical protein